MKRTQESAQRGLRQFSHQPSRDELEVLDSFSFFDGTLRITFRKRHHGPENGRGNRKPTWSGFCSHQGRTLSVYAGTSKTFDLTKAVAKMQAKL